MLTSGHALGRVTDNSGEPSGDIDGGRVDIKDARDLKRSFVASKSSNAKVCFQLPNESNRQVADPSGLRTRA